MNKPIAFKYRPTKLKDYIGQKHLLDESGIITKMIKEQKLFSLIFFGPPGCGKTTLAKIIAEELRLPYRDFNAVVDNKKRLEELFIEAKMSNGLILIIDEVHRLNKDKQDLLLPHIESGLITIIGATTANPYFSINPAIRSRVIILELYQLQKEDIKKAIEKILKENFPEQKITDQALEIIINKCNGDLRFCFNMLELAILSAENKIIDEKCLTKIPSITNISSFKNGDEHYDLVSAFQKSIRGSDVNAALYYLAIILQSGDLESVERRLSITAYEDIGLANPNLCQKTMLAIECAKKVGYPENLIPLSNVVIELCLSPKSKSANNAIHKVQDLIQKNTFPIPKYLKLNPINMKEEEKYPYDKPNFWPQIQYLPEQIKDIEFYQPNNNPYEKTLKENYEKLKKIKRYNKIDKIPK